MVANRHMSASVSRDPLFLVPAHERKKLLERERRLRRSGDWGAWERLENPRRFQPGWLGQVDHVRRNRVFSVLVRSAGGAIHLAIASLSGDRPSWPEMQRIKNELAGRHGDTARPFSPPPGTETRDVRRGAALPRRTKPLVGAAGRHRTGGFNGQTNGPDAARESA